MEWSVEAGRGEGMGRELSVLYSSRAEEASRDKRHYLFSFFPFFLLSSRRP